MLEHRNNTLLDKVAKLMKYLTSTIFEEISINGHVRLSLTVLVKNR